MNSSDLKHYIELWGQKQTTNQLGETDYIEQKIKNVYAQIIPLTGGLSTIPNVDPQVEHMSVSHKIRIRYYSYPQLSISNWFMYKGIKYEIISINQDFKNKEFVEIVTKAIFE